MHDSAKTHSMWQMKQTKEIQEKKKKELSEKLRKWRDVGFSMVKEIQEEIINQEGWFLIFVSYLNIIIL